MNKSSSPTKPKKPQKPGLYISPDVEFTIVELGERLRYARVLRDQTLAEMAERIGVQPATLSRLERGDGGVSIETLAKALWVMNILDNLDLVASPAHDEEGRRLAIVGAPKRVRQRRTRNARLREILRNL